MPVKKTLKKYQKATLYFSSGTGNSFRVATWFLAACRMKNIPSTLIPVDKARPDEDLEANPKQLLALAFPTHGLMPPWSVIKFLFRMPRKKGAHFLCIPTRGSFYIGPLLIPGAAGLASFLPALVLLFKGFRPRGAVSFDMPVNMTSIHPALTQKHARRVVSRAKKKSGRYFDRFFKKNFLWATRNNLYELLWTIPFLYFLPLFPILYLIIGRFFMGKIMFASSKCIGCGTCAKTCPAGALIMKNGRADKNKRPYWRYNCEACLRCLNFCPQKAILTGHSWAVLLWFIGVWVSSGDFLFTRIVHIIPWLESLRSWWTVELLNAVFYYPAFLVSYYLFFHLLHIKPLNALFSQTTLARFFSQYRAPDTRLSDMTHRTD